MGFNPWKKEIGAKSKSHRDGRFQTIKKISLVPTGLLDRFIAYSRRLKPPVTISSVPLALGFKNN
jgi:hypothetical protein